MDLRVEKGMEGEGWMMGIGGWMKRGGLQLVFRGGVLCGIFCAGFRALDGFWAVGREGSVCFLLWCACFALARFLGQSG